MATNLYETLGLDRNATMEQSANRFSILAFRRAKLISSYSTKGLQKEGPGNSS